MDKAKSLDKPKRNYKSGAIMLAAGIFTVWIGFWVNPLLPNAAGYVVIAGIFISVAGLAVVFPELLIYFP